LVQDVKVSAKSTELADIQRATLQQLRIMSGLRREEAFRGLLVGMRLLQIKESIGHGNFMPWVKANVTTMGQRWVNYLMRLALFFFAKNRVTKSEFLALPGDQLNLDLKGKEGAQRQMVEKAVKFVGDLSLTELLDKHGIKDTKKLGGARDKKTGADKPAQIDPEQLYLQSRDEISEAIARLENLLLRENRLQHLIGHTEEIRGVIYSLNTLAEKVESAAKPLLAKKRPAST
jgi:hypothetical protein